MGEPLDLQNLNGVKVWKVYMRKVYVREVDEREVDEREVQGSYKRKLCIWKVHIRKILIRNVYTKECLQGQEKEECQRGRCNREGLLCDIEMP